MPIFSGYSQALATLAFQGRSSSLHGFPRRTPAEGYKDFGAVKNSAEGPSEPTADFW